MTPHLEGRGDDRRDGGRCVAPHIETVEARKYQIPGDSQPGDLAGLERRGGHRVRGREDRIRRTFGEMIFDDLVHVIESLDGEDSVVTSAAGAACARALRRPFSRRSTAHQSKAGRTNTTERGRLFDRCCPNCLPPDRSSCPTTATLGEGDWKASRNTTMG